MSTLGLPDHSGSFGRTAVTMPSAPFTAVTAWDADSFVASTSIGVMMPGLMPASVICT